MDVDFTTQPCLFSKPMSAFISLILRPSFLLISRSGFNKNIHLRRNKPSPWNLGGFAFVKHKAEVKLGPGDQSS